ncbi:MAG: VWA domain-containing protein [Patescibacteria group bacterium]|nr:VWA domain-containing protein [Patescibacteria group bacterium]
MDNNLTEIVIVLDRSGSMASIAKDMAGGLDTFFEEQKKEPGKALVTLAQFDDKYEVIYSGVDLREVPKTKLEPRGWTALLDAVGKTINEVGSRLAATPEEKRPGKVLFLIITDGYENRSTEFTKKQVKDMIEHQTSKYSWQFVYLGANQDSFTEGLALGINTTANYVASVAGTKGMLGDVGLSTRRYRSNLGYTTK